MQRKVKMQKRYDGVCHEHVQTRPQPKDKIRLLIQKLGESLCDFQGSRKHRSRSSVSDLGNIK